MVEMRVEVEAQKSESHWNEQWQRNRETAAEQTDQREQLQTIRETNARVDENLKAIKHLLWAIGGAIGVYVLQGAYQLLTKGHG